MRLYLCGGSHLAAHGVPATATFPVLLSRALRRRGIALSTRSITTSGDPARLPAELDGQDLAAAAVVVVHRNMYGIPLPINLRLGAQRLAGRALPGPDVFRPRSGRAAELRRRLLAAARWSAGTAFALVRLLGLRRDTDRFAADLLDAARWLREAGVAKLVITTPVPLPARGFPLARTYQEAYARVIRRLPGAVVVDLLGDWRGLEANLSSDPLHLTREGHARMALAIEEALLAAPDQAVAVSS